MQVQAVMLAKYPFEDAYLSFDDEKISGVHGARGTKRTIKALAVDSPGQLRPFIQHLLDTLARLHDPGRIFLSLSGSRGVGITGNHEVHIYQVEVQVEEQWLQLHDSTAQAAIDADLASLTTIV